MLMKYIAVLILTVAMFTLGNGCVWANSFV